MNENQFDNYSSVFSWRYGSDEMRALWSEAHKHRLWRRLWVALAEAQAEVGLVSPEQAADLRAHAAQVDVARALEIEAEIHHDLMAGIKTFAEQCPLGGGIIHLGATSTDIEDNTDALRLRQALDLVLLKLEDLLGALVEQVERWSSTPCMGFTHIQPAEPTTLGYRLAQYAQDLLTDLDELRRLRDGVRGKGFKGATGTSASYDELLKASPPSVPPKGGEASPPSVPPKGEETSPPLGGIEGGKAARLEARVMAAIGLEAFPVCTQTYPRKQDWLALNGLAGLAGSLYKLAFDLRLLQSPLFGELSEPFGNKQVGSSAMPFKRNPVNAENMNSLARLVASLPRVAWDNAAHSLLERTLDDSANRRVVLPQAFLATDELLRRAVRIARGLVVYPEAMERNLATYGLFAATERLLMVATRAGADRQELHEIIREHSMASWAAIQKGAPNPLADELAADERLTRFIPPDQIRALLDARAYVGNAPQRARNLAQAIRSKLT